MKWPWVARRRLEAAETDKTLLRHQLRALEAERARLLVQIGGETMRAAERIDRTFRLKHGLGHAGQAPEAYPIGEAIQEGVGRVEPEEYRRAVGLPPYRGGEPVGGG